MPKKKVSEGMCLAKAATASQKIHLWEYALLGQRFAELESQLAIHENFSGGGMAREADVVLGNLIPSEDFVGVVISANVRIDQTGARTLVPAILTPCGIVAPLLDFCVANSEGRSVDWLRKLCHACIQFLEFASANRNLTDVALLDAFAQRLLTGTVGRDGIDSSWLCWSSTSREAAWRKLSQLVTFLKSLPDLRKHLRTWDSSYDQVVNQAAYIRARNEAFLGHVWSGQSKRESLSSALTTTLPRSVNASRGEPTRFPDERFMDLLFTGWRVNGKYSFRDQLITLLLHGAGVRPSEVYHLYISDIFPSPLNPSTAEVLFHHPTEGVAPEDWLGPDGIRQGGNRQQYLAERGGIPPRSKRLNSKHAGWKGAALVKERGSKFFRAQWFVPQLGEIFLLIWPRYLEELVYFERRHPFAMVNIRRGELGAEYTMGAYRKAHAAAVKRIGLQPSKLDGTSPYGHRHAYGTRLAKAGLPGADIQRLMHHLSIHSHLVYTQPFQSEVAAMLQRAGQSIGAREKQKWDSVVTEAAYQLRTE